MERGVDDIVIQENLQGLCEADQVEVYGQQTSQGVGAHHVSIGDGMCDRRTDK